MSTPSLNDVKPGDDVFHYCGYHSIFPVISVTEKHIVINMGENGVMFPVCFKKNGKRHGWPRESIRAAAAQEIQDFKDEKQWKGLSRELNNMDWCKFNLATLRAVKAIIPNPDAK